ncbi:DNA methyltransferase [Bacillus massilinigeriensis]|uniref:DNA methyltransferase n=1 Tax=Bacillus massilionigeriensis TaxID=1805475 RepID=UPI00096B3F6D|nr:DNA methyltransferase [Bacillus massilionigeriensis]
MANKGQQLSFTKLHSQVDNGPVVCLGMTFNNEKERREYFRSELRKKLPELKNIEGFPVGEDEDIIALSDPPYYTACPNPWINDFIDEWEKEKVERDSDIKEEYHRKPFASNVSEGKSHPIYMAHRYHTKVPHRAIMNYILHYTNPGDVIIDGFSGSGMTGLAGKLCGLKEEINKIGYNTENNNDIINSEGYKFSSIGERKVILNDLSPMATYISKNINNFSERSVQHLIEEVDIIIKDIEKEYGWVFETKHFSNEKEKSEFGMINYTVWSETFLCPNCSNEIVYFDATVDFDKKEVSNEITCTNCGYKSNKKTLERAYEAEYDQLLNKVIQKVKLIPVFINYSIGKTRFFKRPDADDMAKLNEVKRQLNNYWYPTNKMLDGEESSRNDKYGLTNVHHMMPDRNKLILAAFLHRIKIRGMENLAKIILTASIPNLTWNYSWRMNGKGGFISGTLYIPSTPQENNALNQIKRKLNDYVKALGTVMNNYQDTVITTQSLTDLNIKANSVDYIFTDPPFGSNLMYSELNFIWESWLKVFTNNKTEAIINKTQSKKLFEYQSLLEKCFQNYYKVLKPGRWMTVEFSNSQSSVWNAIQEAIQKAGFVVANVSALDKKQGSFKAITTTVAVKQDLVISAYKPKRENVDKIIRQQNTVESTWTFVKQHLEQLPVFVGQKGEAQVITERTPRILFDRMVAYHVQNSLPVPISSAEFQVGVTQRFPMRDGMAFLEDQVAEYDKKRTLVKEFSQLSLFVSDESSAIEWIRQQLMKKPQSRQDIHPNFMKEIQHIAKHELLPELDDLLYQNFLLYDGDGQVPDQIVLYLRRTYKDLRGLDKNDSTVIEKAKKRWYVPDPTKQADLEKLREKSLLREFEGYLEEMEGNKKKLRQFRTEAIRAGFKKAYSEKDFDKIVKIGERLPENIIQEDDKLLMYYDNACIRLGL